MQKEPTNEEMLSTAKKMQNHLASSPAEISPLDLLMGNAIKSLAENGLITDRKKTQSIESQESIREKQVQEIMEQINVPKRYRNAEISMFVDVTGEKPDWSRKGFCLRGVTGCGKSTLAAALLRDRLMRDKSLKVSSVDWISVVSYVERIKSAAHPQSKERGYDILRSYRKKRLLVIDDLGKQRDHDWDKSTMISLLWQAYDESQDLIITTQKTLSDVEGWDDALASRIGTLMDIPLEQIDRRHEKRK